RPAFVLTDHHGPMVGGWHAHRRAQLVHAADGVLIVNTETAKYVAPPERAIWVPAGMRHSVASRRPFHLLTLYVDQDFPPLPAGARVVAVDRLVAELLGAAARFGADYPSGGAEERLIRVLLDRLLVLEVAPLHLPDPQSSALARIAAALAANPADRRTLG